MKVRRISITFSAGIALCALLFPGAEKAAAWPEAEVAPGDSRPEILLGYEVELKDQKLARVVPFLDLDYLSEAVRANAPDLLSDERLANYLQNPTALAALPADVRDYLTRGLGFERDETLAQQTARLRESPLPALDPTAATLNAPRIPQAPGFLSHPQSAAPFALGGGFLPLRQGIIGANVPQQSPIPGSAFQAAPATASQTSPFQILNERRMQDVGAITLTRSDRHEEMLARWKRLPLERRRELAEFRYLSPLVIGDIISNLPVEAKEPKALAVFVRPKADAPGWLKRTTLTLDGMRGTTATKVLELSQTGMRESLDEFFADLDQMKRELGLASQIDTPTLLTRSDVAFHLHASVPRQSERSNRSFAKVLQSWKQLALLRLLEAGPHYDGILNPAIGRFNVQGTMNLYDHPLTSHISFLNQPPTGVGHVEIKEHWTNPRAEIEEYQKLMRMDEAEAVRYLNAQSAEILARRPDFVEKMLKKNPAMVFDFAPPGPAGDAMRERAIVALRPSFVAPGLQTPEGLHNISAIVMRLTAKDPPDFDSAFAVMEKLTRGTQMNPGKHMVLLPFIERFAEFAPEDAERFIRELAFAWEDKALVMDRAFFDLAQKAGEHGLFPSFYRVAKQDVGIAMHMLDAYRSMRGQDTSYEIHALTSAALDGLTRREAWTRWDWNQLQELFDPVDGSHSLRDNGRVLELLKTRRASAPDAVLAAFAQKLSRNQGDSAYSVRDLWKFFETEGASLSPSVLDSLRSAVHESGSAPRPAAFYARILAKRSPRPAEYAEIYANLLAHFLAGDALSDAERTIVTSALDELPVDFSRLSQATRVHLSLQDAKATDPRLKQLFRKLFSGASPAPASSGNVSLPQNPCDDFARFAEQGVRKTLP